MAWQNNREVFEFFLTNHKLYDLNRPDYFLYFLFVFICNLYCVDINVFDFRSIFWMPEFTDAYDNYWNSFVE